MGVAMPIGCEPNPLPIPLDEGNEPKGGKTAVCIGGCIGTFIGKNGLCAIIFTSGNTFGISGATYGIVGTAP